MAAQNVAVDRAGAFSPRRVGFIIPSSNRRFEPEAAAYLPAGIVPHIARARMTGAQKAVPEIMEQRILDAARSLADARCELVFLHCTAHSTELGPDGERRLIETMREATGVAGAATGLAIRAALDALRARRIAVVTPYDVATTNEEVHYLEACGFEVVYVRAYDLAGSDAFCATPPEFWRKAMIADREGCANADAVLVSCANIRCLESLEEIEAAAMRPVVTSNQAALWFSARTVAEELALSDLGRLSKLQLASSAHGTN
jgi:maleate cis-trans isomerase